MIKAYVNLIQEKSDLQAVTPFQIIILLLSIYVLIAVFIVEFISLPENVVLLLDYIDTGICFIFIYDFFYRLYCAKDKWRFLKWGWIDLVSSIPAIGVFRFGRVIRVFRILRILRAFRSSRRLIAFLFEHRAKGALASAVLIAIVMVIFSSITILICEKDPASNIKTPLDALWWSLVTISTVGYGDKFPVTMEGRVIALMLIFAGIGLFATFTGFLASIFLEGGQKKEQMEIESIVNEISLLKEEIHSLRREQSNEHHLQPPMNK
jgi:voltage-gated potassium channel